MSTLMFFLLHCLFPLNSTPWNFFKNTKMNLHIISHPKMFYKTTQKNFWYVRQPNQQHDGPIIIISFALSIFFTTV